MLTKHAADAAQIGEKDREGTKEEKGVDAMETLEESGIDIHAEAQPAKRHCGKKPRKKEAAMGKTKKRRRRKNKMEKTAGDESENTGDFNNTGARVILCDVRRLWWPFRPS